jgi:protein-arginine kinase activator protein McsA
VNCHSCGGELQLDRLQNGKQRRAAHVCEDCVRKSMTTEELNILLHPKHTYCPCGAWVPDAVWQAGEHACQR